VDRGRVRLRSDTTESPVQENVTLRDESVHVERRPADRAATPSDLQAFEEGTLEFRETREQPVVRKQPRVIEEVVVRKESQDRQEAVHDVVRESHIDIEAAGTDEFRRDFERRFKNSGYSYEQVEPAYRFGARWGSDQRYRGRAWPDIESEARRDWEADRSRGAWEQFKEAVRAGWERIRTRR
jgi:hypothetical protein